MLSMADIILLSFVVSTILLLGWLFMGVFREREFGTHHIFLKHCATFKFIFLPPPDGVPTSELNEKEKHNAHIYRLFVEERGGSSRSLFIGF